MNANSDEERLKIAAAVAQDTSRYKEVSQKWLKARKRLTEIEHWRIKDGKVLITNRINRNINVTSLTDSKNEIEHFVTNKQGAIWLNAVIGDWMVRTGYPRANPKEEFADSWSDRAFNGTLMVGLGMAEFIGGVGVVIETAGIGAVAGVALTTSGFDVLTQGMKMWTCPVETHHEQGWVGDAVHQLGINLGWDDEVSPFDVGWMMMQIGAGFGATPALRSANLKLSDVHYNDSVAKRIPNGTLHKADVSVNYLKGLRGAKGLNVDLFPLPSGRGILVEIEGGEKFLIPKWENPVRVLQRIQGVNVKDTLSRIRLLKAKDAGFNFNNQITNLDQTNKLVIEVAAHMGLSAATLKKHIDSIQFKSYEVPTNKKIPRHSLVEAAPLPVNKQRDHRTKQPNSTDQNYADKTTLHVSNGIGKPWLSNTDDYNQFIAFNEIAHDINHAMAYQIFIANGGNKSKFWALYQRNSREYSVAELRAEQNTQMITTTIAEQRIQSYLDEGRFEDADKLRYLLADLLQDSSDYINFYKRILED